MLTIFVLSKDHKNWTNCLHRFLFCSIVQGDYRLKLLHANDAWFTLDLDWYLVAESATRGHQRHYGFTFTCSHVVSYIQTVTKEKEKEIIWSVYWNNTEFRWLITSIPLWTVSILTGAVSLRMAMPLFTEFTAWFNHDMSENDVVFIISTFQ